MSMCVCGGFVFTLTVIMPAPLCSCLHSRNHTHVASAKCFLCVHACKECVGVCAGEEGVEYLPRGYDKVTDGRQWTAKRSQTCPGRMGLAVHSLAALFWSLLVFSRQAAFESSIFPVCVLNSWLHKVMQTSLLLHENQKYTQLLLLVHC